MTIVHNDKIEHEGVDWTVFAQPYAVVDMVLF